MRIRNPMLLAAVVSTLAVHAVSATPLGTGFGFQGRLLRNGVPVSGTVDIRYTLWDDGVAGVQKGAAVTQLAVAVTDGLVSTTLDFGSQFDGNRRWVQVEVKGPSDVSFVVLTPRFEVLPVPYAMWAGAGPSGLNLPYIGMLSSPSNLFEVRNTMLSTTAAGIRAEAQAGVAIEGVTNQGNQDAVRGTRLGDGSGGAGVHGEGRVFSTGVYGNAEQSPGVIGYASNAIGVFGSTGSGPASGVYGQNDGVYPAGAGVTGYAQSLATGVYGYSGGGYGVLGKTAISTKAGVKGTTDNAGAYGGWFENTATGGIALYANGEVQVGVLSISGGADLAENFETAEKSEPGTVLAIDPAAPGRLRVCGEAYSHGVAGVVSGANALPAGVVLGHDMDVKGGQPVALSGRVWVRCDASTTPIRPGDLLTTAARPGYAMKAANLARAQGAILGKAMSSLEAGTGLVLVLVSLQ